MPRIIPIQDLNQPELDVFFRLTENQLRNRLEPEKSIFIAQSPKVIDVALQSGCEPVAVLTEPKHLECQALPLFESFDTLPIYIAAREQLAQITGFALTRGILCAMRRPAQPSLEQLCAGASRIAVLDGIVDATNVGAILRSAAALNMDGVIVTSGCCDPLNRRAVRVSMGTVLQVPWTEVDSGPAGKVPPWLTALHQMGFKTAAMALRPNTLDLDDPVLLEEPRLAVILGEEGYGLPDAIIQACSYTVCIPMSHGVDSLNVGAAGAVAFWQLGHRAGNGK